MFRSGYEFNLFQPVVFRLFVSTADCLTWVRRVRSMCANGARVVVVCLCAYMYACARVHACVCDVRVRPYAYMRVCVRVCACVRVCVYSPMRGLAKIAYEGVDENSTRQKKNFFSRAYDVCDENTPGAHEGFGENQVCAHIYTHEGVHENTPMRHLTKLTYTHEGMHENTHMRGLTKIN